MRWKRYRVNLELTGMTRKRAAEIMGELFQMKAEYSFDGDKYTVKDSREREWIVAPGENIRSERYMNGRMVGANHLYHMKICSPLLYESDFDMLSKVVTGLDLGGAVTNETTNLIITLEAIGIKNKERYQKNLENIFAGKGALFQKALDREFDALADCSQMDKNGTVAFQIFKSTLQEQEEMSCIQLAQTISSYAEKQKKISQKGNDSPNEKFLFRTWLVRAGMVGDEFKFARKMFTENLQGNSAWLKKYEDSVQVLPELEETMKLSEPEMSM